MWRPLLLTAAASTAFALKTANVAAASWGLDRIDVFGTVESEKNTSSVWHKYFHPAGGWEPHGKSENLGTLGQLGVSSSVSTWGSERLDYFAVDAAGQPWHKYWDGSNWNPKNFEKLQGDEKVIISSTLAAVSWGADRIDVVGATPLGTFAHLYYDGHNWVGWEDIWGLPATNISFPAAPALVSWGPNRFDVFGIGNDSRVYHKFWDGTQYQPIAGWELLAWQAPVAGFQPDTLTATSWGPNRMDVWAVGVDGALYHTLWDHDYYGGWEALGGEALHHAPAVAHWARGRIDIVVRDKKTGGYLYKFYDGYGWRPDVETWYPKGKFVSAPVVTSWGANNLNILGVGVDGGLYWQAWNQTQWVPNAEDFALIGNVETPFEEPKENATKEIVAEMMKKSNGQTVLEKLKSDM